MKFRMSLSTGMKFVDATNGYSFRLFDKKVLRISATKKKAVTA